MVPCLFSAQFVFSFSFRSFRTPRFPLFAACRTGARPPFDPPLGSTLDISCLKSGLMRPINYKTRQSKQCGFSIYIFDNSKSKSMVRLVKAEKMVLSGLVFARKIARMILIQNILGLMGPLMINMAFMPLYM